MEDLNFSSCRVLHKRAQEGNLGSRFHFFNSFFWKKLTEKDTGDPALPPAQRNFERVKSWTKVCLCAVS